MRSFKWDNVKAGLILLVIMGHIASEYTDDYPFARSIFLFIYLFHMPAFFFVSGLYGKKVIDGETMNWRKIAPYLILGFFLGILRNITGAAVGSGSVSFSLLSLDNADWYLFVLFIFYLFTHIIRKVSPRYVMVMALLISILIGYDTRSGNFLAIYRLAYFFPFFYGGYLLDPDKVEEALRGKAAKAVGIVLIMAMAFCCYRFIGDLYQFRRLVTGANSYYSLPMENIPLWVGLYRIPELLLTALACLGFFAMVPGRRIPYVSDVLGRRTLAVYMFHQIGVDFLTSRAWFEELFRGSNVKMLGVMVVTSLILLIIFSTKIFYKPLELVLNINDREDSLR